MNGKGDKRRPVLVDPEVEHLRWELAFGGHSVERKDEIRKRLKELVTGCTPETNKKPNS